MPEPPGPELQAAPRAAAKVKCSSKPAPAPVPAKNAAAFLAPQAKVKLAPTPKYKQFDKQYPPIFSAPEPASRAVWKSLSPREPQHDQPGGQCSGCMAKPEPLKMKEKETEKEKKDKAKPQKARATSTVKKKEQVMK